MNSPIQWFLLLWCGRRTATTLFNAPVRRPPVDGTRRIGKDSPVHRPDGLRPSRRRIAARDQRFEGYPNTLACHIRRAAGTHEYLYYDSAGQRRAGPRLTSLGQSAPCTFLLLLAQQSRECVAQHTHTRPPNAIFPGMRRKKANATQQVPPRRLCHTGGGHRQGGYIMFLFTTCRFCVICFQHILVLFHIRWEPLATRPLCRITLPLSTLLIIAKPPSRNARYINRE